MSGVATIAPDEPDLLRVLEGVEIRGRVNLSDAIVLGHITHAIRQWFPQLRPESPKADRVVIVGGGPSLTETESELRDLIFAGAKVVALNGAYQWCIARNIHPSAMIMLDGRESNVRFLDPAVPRCKYFLASQCHPNVWPVVADREVILWHALSPDHPEHAVLDRYYGAGHWMGVTGGTTVATRAIGLLRTIGYLRFDLFGIDSCWLDGQHHAFAQEENERDTQHVVRVEPTGHPEMAREFTCAPWHLKQLEDALQLVRVSGHHFQLCVHGRGLIAAAIQDSAMISIREGA